MLETETIQCPFCGQSFELAVDTSVASQRFTTDCEVCCRPFEVVAECEAGEILSLDVLCASSMEPANLAKSSRSLGSSLALLIHPLGPKLGVNFDLEWLPIAHH